ncbi:MAG: NfeD family protein [Acidobacteriota bacterium]
MKVWQRYFLIQLPGWGLAAMVLFGFRHWLGLPLWAACLIVVLVIAKDFVIFPLVRPAYETVSRTPLEELIGEPGVAKQLLDPGGYVQVKGELWLADAVPEHRPIQPASSVRVLAVHDGRLQVKLDEDLS